MNLNELLSPPCAQNPLHYEALLRLSHDEEKTLWQMIKDMDYQKFLQTRYWYTVSAEARGRAGSRCQVCNADKLIEIHHRTYGTHGEEHRHLNDLTALCRKCHGIFHGCSKVKKARNKTAPTAGFLKLKKLRQRGGKRVWRDYPSIPSQDLIPPGDRIMLTRDNFRRCFKVGKYMSNATRDALVGSGYAGPGWERRIKCHYVTRDQYWAALEGRFK